MSSVSLVCGRRLHIVLALCVVLVSASSGVHPWVSGTAAAGLVVTTAADDTNDDGDCSLREALANANDNALTHDDCLVAGMDAGDEISFALPANSTIALTDGPLAIEDDVVIDGSAVPGLTISGNNTTRVFAIGQTNSGFAVTISDLRIIDAFLTSDEAIGTRLDGGAVLIGPGVEVTMSGVTISGTITNLNFNWTGGGIHNKGSLTLRDSMITGNTVEAYSTGYGAGIYSEGNLTLEDTTVSANRVMVGFAGLGLSVGGGIYSTAGSVTLVRSEVSGNQAIPLAIPTVVPNVEAFGGGIAVEGGNVTLIDSTIRSNKAEGSPLSAFTDVGASGGGILLVPGLDGSGTEFIPGTLVMTRSTVSGNTASGIGSAGLGGGIFVADLDAPATATGTTATITNSTISGNTASGLASSGGGLGGGAGAYRASVTFINSTVNRNSADGGGGFFSEFEGRLTLTNTIVGNNTGGNCLLQAGTTFSASFSLADDTSCFDGTVDEPPAGAPWNRVVTDVGLGPLQNNGGLTETHALLAGSAAIDNGDNAVCAATAPEPAVAGIDQRYVVRPQDGNGDGVAVCDIGAYEVGVPDLVVTKLCLGEGYEATFRITVAGVTEEAGCNESVVAPDLAPGTYTVAESIEGPDSAAFVTVIACEGGETVIGRTTTATVPEGTTEDVTCIIVNIFDPPVEEDEDDGDGGPADREEPPSLIVVGSIEIDNANGNAVGVDNANRNGNANGNANANQNENENTNGNDNANTNSQTQENRQGQDNTNEQTNDVNASPEVNIDSRE